MTPPPFVEFFAEQRGIVFRYLVLRIGPHEAEDCFQETFLAALRAYPRLAPASNPRAWVLKIAERKALDALRARARRPQPVAEVPEDGSRVELPDLDPGLWRAVGALPDKQLAVVAMRFVGDLAYADIGRALDISEDAARQNARAGLRTLRKVVT